MAPTSMALSAFYNLLSHLPTTHRPSCEYHPTWTHMANTKHLKTQHLLLSLQKTSPLHQHAITFSRLSTTKCPPLSNGLIAWRSSGCETAHISRTS